MAKRDRKATPAPAPKVAPQLPRRQAQRSFPASTFEEPLEFARSIFRIGGGQPIRRLTLFDQLGKSPESSGSRQLITNASKYGLTRGHTGAENIELTLEGRKAVDEQVSAREQARTRIALAIEGIELFKTLYDKTVNNKLPSKAVLFDTVRSIDVSADHAAEAVDTFIVNLSFVGLLKTLSGAERVLPIDMHLDQLPSATRLRARHKVTALLSYKICNVHSDLVK